MTFHSHPTFVRMLVGTIGALLLGSICLGSAVGPAQMTPAATVSSTLTA